MVPFDADLGTDRDGHVVATYSRCRREDDSSRTPTGCGLFTYNFKSARERPLHLGELTGFSRVMPSMWRGRLAFATYRDPGNRQAAVTHSIRVISPDGAIRRVGGGTRRGPTIADADGVVTRLDLREGNVTYSWSYTLDCGPATDDDLFLPFGTEIWKAQLGRRSQRVTTACNATTGVLLPRRSMGEGCPTRLRQVRRTRLPFCGRSRREVMAVTKTFRR